jgi:formate dehydrogenase major subunit
MKIESGISGNRVQISIDGKIIHAEAGSTVLQAAKQNGIYIPSLCDYKGLLPYGSCRLCSVIAEGKKGYLSSCSLYVENGMKIKTVSDELFSLKKTLMELYLSDHPNDCLTCLKNGMCELQGAASYFGLREIRYRGKSHLNLPVDGSNPYFLFDPKRCVVCARCVRACAEIQGNFALTITGRGFNSVIKAGWGNESSFFNSECVSCGACVKACPTGALVEKSVAADGKAFYKTRTTCGYCGVGCSFNVESKGDKIIRAVPVDESLSNFGHSCIKGRFSFGYVKSCERLKSPLVRENLSMPFKEVSWKDAFDFIAGRFLKIQEKYGKNAIGAISSSRCTNEENYLMQKLTRAVFNNNNIDTCARVCHQPTGYGLGVAFGAGAGTQDLSSIFESDLIMVIGSNPTEAHPVVGSFIRKMARQGAKLIVIDPRKTEVSKSPHIAASYHLRPLPGTNVILLNAMAHYILKENLIKKDFINERCDHESFALWNDFIINESNSPDAASKICGVSKKDIEGAARLYAKAANASIFYGLGVTEHLQGSTGVLAIANLAMATGNIGRKGVGVSPLRGQNNVQGAADMGAEPSSLPGYRHISDETARLIFEKIWNVKLDGVPGMRLPDMLRGGLDGRFKGIYIMGEDIVQTDPDSNRIIESLSGMETVVVHDLFNTVTSEYAHVLLPGSSFLEKDGTFTNWERRVQRVRKVIEPIGGLQDWQVIAGLSEAMGYGMNYAHPCEIMDEIAQTTPQFSGLSYDLLEKKDSVQWPVNAENQEGTPVLHKDRFIRGKGRFAITKFIGSKDAVSEEYPFILTTVRNLYQYNCSNNTRRSHNSLWYGQDILEICAEDAEKLDIADAGMVLIKSKKGAVTLNVKISGRVMPGIVATTFHFPEFKTNILTSEYADWSTETPEYKVTAVSITKADAPFISRELKLLFKGNDEIESMFLDICKIFSPYPTDIAVKEIQTHIYKYWEPFLRIKLFEIFKTDENNFKIAIKKVIENL